MLSLHLKMQQCVAAAMALETHSQSRVCLGAQQVCPGFKLTLRVRREVA